jgi:hypothetical protein
MAKDGRYYLRNESTTQTMRDWQVRDTMNRSKVPKLKVTAQKEWDILDGNHSQLKLFLQISNASTILAKYFQIKFRWPEELDRHKATVQAWMPSPRRPNLDFWRSPQLTLTHEQLGPFFPGQTFELEAILTVMWTLGPVRAPDRVTQVIECEMFADDMARTLEQISISDIPAR